MAISAPTRQRVRAVPDTMLIPLTLPNRQHKKEFDLETIDVDMVFYTRDGAPPLTVLMAIEDAWAEYDEDRPTEEETGKLGDPTTNPPTPRTRGTLSARRWVAKQNRADHLLRQRLLVAASDDKLILEDAGVIVSRGEAEGILGDLGWWATESTDAKAEDSGETTGEGSALTGDAASPDSVQPTPDKTPEP